MKSKILKTACLATSTVACTLVMSSAMADSNCDVAGYPGHTNSDGVCVMTEYQLVGLAEMAQKYGGICNAIDAIGYAVNHPDHLPPSIGEIPPAIGQIFGANVAGSDLEPLFMATCNTPTD